MYKATDTYERLATLRDKLNRHPMPQRHDFTGDSCDKALASTSTEQELAIAETMSGRGTSIDEALVRVQQGLYGICESCDKPIPKARLKALPDAKYCIECQIDYEGSNGNSQRKIPGHKLADVTDLFNEDDPMDHKSDPKWRNI
jgi:RNA polymerase-binding transcription factor DksA